ncbi:MAG: hypothetical protein H6712_09530 [Myxococcales bacterium]|nr:hypothetical protein [Myxococcales bacterium]
MRQPLLALPLLLLAVACDPAPPAPRRVEAPSPVAMAAPTETTPAAPSAPTSTDELATRGEVILVPLGQPFPEDVLDAIEGSLRDELQVEVTRHERLPLPRAAYYRPRKRYRADKLLDHLLERFPEIPPTTRVLGLTTTDISTTKGKHQDWGIFGLGLVPGQAAVVSIHRLRRGAKDRAQLRNRAAITAIHEVGHTFGLDHCPEELCPMQDAEGSITNTDTSTGHLGPSCRTTLDARFPLRDTP